MSKRSSKERCINQDKPIKLLKEKEAKKYMVRPWRESRTQISSYSEVVNNFQSSVIS